MGIGRLLFACLAGLSRKLLCLQDTMLAKRRVCLEGQLSRACRCLLQLAHLGCNIFRGALPLAASCGSA
jgi:hypothetical protein